MTGETASVLVAAIAAGASVLNTYLLGRTRRDVTEINHAVNNRPQGESTISEQVSDLHHLVIPGRRHDDPPKQDHHKARDYTSATAQQGKGDVRYGRRKGDLPSP